MKLTDLYDSRLVRIRLPGRTKTEILRSMAALFVEAGKVTDLERFIADLQARELSFSTGVGRGLAIPHGKSEVVSTAAYAVATLSDPFLWDADDDETTNLVVMLAVPAREAGTTHLKMLSTFAAALMDDGFRTALVNATTEADIRSALQTRGA
ncbi:PTS sugar transporter subunit IIA [Raineyella sp. LH-20]|uniref:PTS sugar transporter subunit IIA n=1 Tax=Raineyella sp. LH-20 TaxID=3081204 RepID=UPI002954E49F|nr:PTS sugar transporter subunit IIA [Raineyella sp. LH-20]WOP19956.1 PTS sugar transporter subunit IIA [Raineyella sp. LH-20]